jgi:hypothetical protein
MANLVKGWLARRMQDAESRDAEEHRRIDAAFERTKERKAMWAAPLSAPVNDPTAVAFFKLQAEVTGAAGSKYRAASTTRANSYESALQLCKNDVPV